MFTRQQLEVFRAVLSTGSMSAAAERLHLSQPSISRLMGELQDQFGCALFTRKSKGIQPTPEALLFLHEVEKTYDVLANLEQMAHEISQNQRGILVLGSNVAMSFEIVPKALKALGVLDNNISLSWQVKTSRWIMDFASAGTLDLGISHIEDTPTNVKILYQKALPHYCVLPKGHPLVETNQRLQLDQLADYRLIGLSGEVAKELRYLGSQEKQRTALTVEVSIAALSLAEQGDALAIVDPFTARHWLVNRDLVALPIEGLTPYKLAIFKPTGEKSSHIIDQLKLHLIDQIEGIAQCGALYSAKV